MPIGRRLAQLGLTTREYFMTSRSSTACRLLWALTVLLISLGLAAGCSGSGSTKTGNGADSADATDDSQEVAAVDIVQPPTLAVTLTPSTKAGNAPLDVTFKAAITGTDKANCFITWDFGDGLDPQIFNLNQPDMADKDVITRSFTGKGAYTVSVKVEWKPSPKKAHAEATTEIVVSSPASLQFSSDPPVALNSPEVVIPGDDVTLTFAIVNQGDDVPSPFAIGIYISATDTLDASAIAIASVPVASLASGAIKSWTFNADPAQSTALVAKVPAIADGNYFVLVAIDPSSTVNEDNRLDNIAYANTQLQVNTKASAKPDLAITKPQFAANKVYSPGDKINLNYEVSNVGQGTATSVKYGIFISKDKVLDYDPTIAANDPKQDKGNGFDWMLTNLGNSTIKSLDPNASIPFLLAELTPDLADGSYYLIAKVDLLGSADETNEDNNIAIATEPFVIKKIVKNGVDLGLEAMTVKPKGVALNDSINVLYTVKNLGTLPTPTFPATVFFCPFAAFNASCIQNKTKFTVPPLAVGQSLSDAVKVKIAADTPIQNWTIYLQLDPDDTIAELDETNNIMYFKDLKVVAQSSVDLWPANVGVHPSAVQAGDTVKVGYVIHNDGVTGSGASTTYYALTSKNACSLAALGSGDAILVKKAPLAGVDPMDQTSVAEIVTIPLGLPHGITDYKMCVILDAEKNIPKETNPNNNTALAVDTLTVNGAQGGCFEDAGDLANNHNDLQTQALPLPTDATNLGSCGNDDWWKVSVVKGDSLTVTLTVTPDLWVASVPNDLDLALVGPDGTTVLDASKLPGSPKKASALTVTATGDYYIHVNPHVPGAQAQYALDVAVIGPPKSPDLFAAAITVNPQVTFAGALIKVKTKLSNLGVQGAGPFHLRYFLSQTPAVDVTTATVLKDVIVAGGLGGLATQFIDDSMELPQVAGGKWFVAVQADATDMVTEANEKNNIAISTTLTLSSQLVCAADTFIGNHTANDAAPLPSQSAIYPKLNVCPGLEDWFVVQVPQGKAFSAAMNWTYKSGAGLVGVQILDSSKSAVVAGSAQPFNEIAKIPYTQVGGLYYIHTYVLPETGTPSPYDYALTVTIADPDPTDVCLADYYEQNNSADSSPEVGCGVANLSLCLGDEDWFHLTMKQGEVVTFDFQNAANAFQFKVFANANLPAVQTLAGNGTLKFIAPSQGMYYMQVSYKSPGVKPSAFAYTLKVDGGKGIDLIPKIDSIFPSQVVQGEDVYVKAHLNNACQDPAGGFNYAYYLSQDAVLDAKDVQLTQKALLGLAGKTQADLNDKAPVPIDYKPGPAFLILAADSTNVVAESQELNNTDGTALEVVQLCLADVFEPNGAPQIASQLPAGTNADLSLCPYDLDWYQFSATTGETITLTLSFDGSKGDLDLRLYKVGQFGAPVAASATKNAPEQIIWTADETTKYYVRINGFAGDSNSYSLALCQKFGGSCIECKDNSVCGANQVCDPTTTLCGAKPCIGGDASACNDGNQCTVDTCSVAQKCLNTPSIASACSDGNACTLGEACSDQGACVTASGTTVSTLPLSVTGTDMASSATTTEGGGLAIVGARDIGNGLQGWLQVRDATGNVLFNKVYDQLPSPSHLHSVVRLPAGQLIAVGDAAVNGAPGKTQGWWQLIDANTGTTLNSKLFPVAGQTTNLWAVALTSTGSVVTGQQAQASDGVKAAGWTLALDPVGNTLWTETNLGFNRDLVVLPGGDVVVVGHLDLDLAQVGQMQRLHSSTGKTVWAQQVPGADLTLNAVALASDATLVVVGAKDTAAQGLSSQGLILWLNLDGTLQKQATVVASTPQKLDFIGTSTNGLLDVLVRADGTLWLAGWTGSSKELNFSIEGAIWHLGLDAAVLGVWATGGPAADELDQLVAWGQATVAVGSLAANTAAADATLLQVLPPQANCNDGNPCTIDNCDVVNACQSKPAADGAPCGVGLTCQQGACQ